MRRFFGRKASGILAPRPGVEPSPPALEGEVLATGLPGTSLLAHSSVLFFFLLAAIDHLYLLFFNLTFYFILEHS